MDREEIKKSISAWVGRDHIDGTTRRLLSTAMDQIVSLEKERDHWKANHADQVRRARVLLERHDLPLERIAAYDQVLRLQNALKVATKTMRQHAGMTGPMHGWWDDIGEFEAILAGKPTRLDWLKEQN
ncbi:hypothetical protein [Paraburkholderia sp.]|uniref:hypothetical protein n=1 Tax=Paraburkholderia sp. TaxID=1926495 RepID=UPI0039E52D39